MCFIFLSGVYFSIATQVSHEDPYTSPQVSLKFIFKQRKLTAFVLCEAAGTKAEVQDHMSVQTQHSHFKKSRVAASYQTGRLLSELGNCHSCLSNLEGRLTGTCSMLR